MVCLAAHADVSNPPHRFLSRDDSYPLFGRDVDRVLPDKAPTLEHTAL